MPTYFDTSALVPLLIDEPTTENCRVAWNEADVVMSSSIAFVEVHAALAQARRLGRVDAVQHRVAIDDFAAVWSGMQRIAVTDAIVQRAAVLASTHALRGYDAVHCATALAAASDDFVAVTGDRDLLRAWSDLGIATVDIAR